MNYLALHAACRPLGSIADLSSLLEALGGTWPTAAELEAFRRKPANQHYNSPLALAAWFVSWVNAHRFPVRVEFYQMMIGQGHNDLYGSPVRMSGLAATVYGDLLDSCPGWHQAVHQTLTRFFWGQQDADFELRYGLLPTFDEDPRLIDIGSDWLINNAPFRWMQGIGELLAHSYEAGNMPDLTGNPFIDLPDDPDFSMIWEAYMADGSDWWYWTPEGVQSLADLWVHARRLLGNSIAFRDWFNSQADWDEANRQVVRLLHLAAEAAKLIIEAAGNEEAYPGSAIWSVKASEWVFGR